VVLTTFFLLHLEKMNKKSKNYGILFALFILPLVFYILVSTGINNFGKLAIVTPKVLDISEIDSAKTTIFKDKISIVCFLGDDMQSVKGGIFNLNQKIYKPFYGFVDFQIVAIYPKDKEKEMNILKKEIGGFTDMEKWKFVAASKEKIILFYKSFKTENTLKNAYTPKAFIIDREGNLRGRLDDDDIEGGKLFGYNMHSVAELNNKMKDDVKVLLAEYRLALKKNGAKRKI